jgi:hypothetical protein
MRVSAHLVSEKQARIGARSLIFTLQMAFPHPYVFRVCYSLCWMVDQFPVHAMAFGQTAIISILTRYLGLGALPQDDLAAVICAFQRLFFHRDAHFVYLYSDRDLIPMLIALIGCDSIFVSRTALRTIQIAIASEPAIGDALCEGALLETVARLVDAEPPFSLLKEIHGLAVLLIGAVTANVFFQVLAVPVMARVIGALAELQDEQMAVAVEIAMEKCSVEGLLPRMRESIAANGLSEAIAAFAESRPAFREII